MINVRITNLQSLLAHYYKDLLNLITRLSAKEIAKSDFPNNFNRKIFSIFLHENKTNYQDLFNALENYCKITFLEYSVVITEDLEDLFLNKDHESALEKCFAFCVLSEKIISFSREELNNTIKTTVKTIENINHYLKGSNKLFFLIIPLSYTVSPNKTVCEALAFYSSILHLYDNSRICNSCGRPFETTLEHDYVCQNCKAIYIESKIQDITISKKHSHKCFGCGRELSFSGLITTNPTKNRNQLEEWWKNNNISFYCCDCYKNETCKNIGKTIDKIIEAIIEYFGKEIETMSIDQIRGWLQVEYALIYSNLEKHVPNIINQALYRLHLRTI